MDSVVLFVQQFPEGIGKLMHALPSGVKQLFQAAPEFPGQSGMEVVLPLRLFQLPLQPSQLPGVGLLLHQLHAPPDHTVIAAPGLGRKLIYHRLFR